MENFYILAPILAIDFTPSGVLSPLSLVSFCTSYLSDLWTVHSLDDSDEGITPNDAKMSFSIVQTTYQVVLNITTGLDPSPSQTEEDDILVPPTWVSTSSCSHEFLADTFTSYEAINEAMTGPKQPWEDMHHRSYFLSELKWIEHDEFWMNLREKVVHPILPLGTHNIYNEGNMANTSPIISINIS